MSKTRRRSQILSALLLFLLGGVGVYWAMQPHVEPGVTLENFRRLYKYMPRSEVEAILGKGVADGDIVRWKDGDNEAAVAFFDSDGAACGSFFSGHKDVAQLREEPEGVFEKLRLWVRQRYDW